MQLDAPAVVLGSTQSPVVLDAAAVEATGRAVARRRSGGGIVVMDPGAMAWIDVVVPAGDPLWHHDVGEAFAWLGRVWASVLTPDAVVHRGAPLHADLGRVVCFAGVGSGEVSVDGAKVVGMSQRRTRTWARFQCLVHGRFDPAESLGVLAPHLTAGAFGERLRDRLTDGVGVVDDLDALTDWLLDRVHDV